MGKALPRTTSRTTTFVSNASTTACAFGDGAIHILQAHRPHAGWRCEASCQKVIYAQLAHNDAGRRARELNGERAIRATDERHERLQCGDGFERDLLSLG